MKVDVIYAVYSDLVVCMDEFPYISILFVRDNFFTESRSNWEDGGVLSGRCLIKYQGQVLHSNQTKTYYHNNGQVGSCSAISQS